MATNKASIWRALREVAAKRSGKVAGDPRPEIQKVRPKAFASDGRNASTDYTTSPYDFTEIDNLFDTDSYAQQALERKIETFFKEGYEIKGSDPEAVQYIKTRCRLIGIAMNQAWDDIVGELAMNIIKYNNLFAIVTRDARPAQITGMSYQGIGTGDPIAGFVLAPVSTMSIKTDARGVVTGYKQTAGSNTAEFKPTDVIHGTFNRQTGQRWGKPTSLVGIEDFIDFRIIEQDILNLVHKEMYPTYVYAVGDEKRPAEEEDLDVAGQRLEEMREVGGLIIPGKDKVETLSNNKTMDVSSHIAHFKERAIISQGVSPYQIGVTTDANKSIAERLDAAFYGKIKAYQRAIANIINERIFFELLLEGGFDPLGINGESQMVRIEFNEIDVDALIKRANHISVLWVQNQITHGEMRERLGLEVDPEKAELYHIDMVEIPLTEAKGAMQPGDNPNSPAKGRSGSQNNPANKSGNRGGPKVKTASYQPSDVDRLLEQAEHLEHELSLRRKT